MTGVRKARMVGFNHVALEVGDIDAALHFYGTCARLELAAFGLIVDGPNAVKAGFVKRERNGSSPTAALGAHERPVAAANCQWARPFFGGIAVDIQITGFGVSA